MKNLNNKRAATEQTNQFADFLAEKLVDLNQAKTEERYEDCATIKHEMDTYREIYLNNMLLLVDKTRKEIIFAIDTISDIIQDDIDEHLGTDED